MIELDKQKKIMIGAGALFALAIVILIGQLMFGKGRSISQSLAEEISSVLTQHPSSQSLPEKSRAQKSMLKQPWGRDPFSQTVIEKWYKPAEPAPAQIQSFILTGILHRGGQRVAIINRYFVREGDLIDNAEILRIDKDKVLLKRGNQEIILRMGPT